MPREVPLRVPIEGAIRVLCRGPCTQIFYTLAPIYLFSDYFKANV